MWPISRPSFTAMARSKAKFKRHFRGRNQEYWRFFLMEEMRCRSSFPNYEVRRVAGGITVKGEIKPDELCRPYKFLVKYQFLGVPEVWILEPDVEYNPHVHMYKDSKKLCLFHPQRAPWKTTDSLSDKIIPWTCAWVLYYELWLLTGRWFGEEAEHGPPIEAA